MGAFDDLVPQKQTQASAFSDLIPEPSIGDRAKRVAGLGARAVTEGVFGLPVLLGDALNQGYNLATGSDRSSVREGFRSLLNNAGLPEPETAVERYSTGITSALTGAVAQMKAAAQAPGEMAKALASSPGRQTAAAVTGPAAAQTTAELGYGPGAQFSAGIAGGAAPFVKPMVTGRQQLTQREQAARNAIDSGYAIPPAEINRNPINTGLSAASGQIKTEQSASLKSHKITDRLVAEDLGLKPGTEITEPVLAGLRKEAGKAYGKIKMLPLKFKQDAEFTNAVDKISGDYAEAVKTFPETTGSAEVSKLQRDLNNAKLISPVAAIEKIKDLRFQASKNGKSFDDPEKAALAKAQRAGANAIEELVERRLEQSGKPDLVREFREARTLIAKTYDVESALTPMGVSARALGKMDNLSGGMAKAGEFGFNFPKAAQDVTNYQPLSALDFYGAMGGLGGGGYAAQATGHPAFYGAAALPLLRPAARALLLSRPYQLAAAPAAQNLTRDQAAILGLLAASRAGSQ
jgi:hypothetical protein